MKKKVLSLLYLFLVMLVGCTTPPLQTEMQSEIIPVQVEKVKKGTFIHIVELSGITKAYQEFPVFAPSPLLVEEVNVSLGEMVQKGDQLLRFSNQELTSQINELEKLVTVYEEKEAQFELALRETMQNLEQLSKEYNKSLEEAQALLNGAQTGAVTMLDLLEASTQLLVLQNQWQAIGGVHNHELQAQVAGQLEQAKLQLQTLRKASDQLIVRAPFAGVITLKNITAQELALPNTLLMQLSNVEQIIVELNVPSTQINQIKQGDTSMVWFEGRAEPVETLVHSLSFGSSLIGKQNQALIILDNSERAFYPGQFVKVEVETEAITDAILVPVQAITFINEQSFVYTVQDNIAKRKEIALGKRNNDYYHVLEGLSEDEQVITLGQERVTDGSTVYIQK